MKRFGKILVPTDLSENSRRGLLYACSLAGDNRATLIVLHVANELNQWEFYSDDFSFLDPTVRKWPTDRVLKEANLDLNRFLEQHLETLKAVLVAKRVVLGPIAEQIAIVAENETADLIIMSPRRHRGLRRFFQGSITDKVTRLSPCPVLSVTSPLPSRPWRGKSVAVINWSRRKPTNAWA
jgi:nucleotide-binding universal stress UspA family protein